MCDSLDYWTLQVDVGVIIDASWKETSEYSLSSGSCHLRVRLRNVVAVFGCIMGVSPGQK